MVSVESLFAEVSPIFSIQQAIRTADQLFFGDSFLYTPHSNIATTSSAHRRRSHRESEHKNKDKKGKGGKDKDSGKNADGLHAAIASAKETVKKALEQQNAMSSSAESNQLRGEIEDLKKENASIRSELLELRNLIECVRKQAETAVIEPVTTKSAPAVTTKPKDDDKEEDFDLFGSSDEEVDEEKERIKQERLKAYAEKKAKKPAGVAKSSVILDVKPWDDETNLEEMEKLVRAIEPEGLVWGGAKFIPLAYGIKTLQIICVIEDEKVSVDDLIDQITSEVSDHVQSVDIQAFNKI